MLNQDSTYLNTTGYNRRYYTTSGTPALKPKKLGLDHALEIINNPKTNESQGSLLVSRTQNGIRYTNIIITKGLVERQRVEKTCKPVRYPKQDQKPKKVSQTRPVKAQQIVFVDERPYTSGTYFSSSVSSISSV